MSVASNFGLHTFPPHTPTTRTHTASTPIRPRISTQSLSHGGYNRRPSGANTDPPPRRHAPYGSFDSEARRHAPYGSFDSEARRHAPYGSFDSEPDVHTHDRRRASEPMCVLPGNRVCEYQFFVLMCMCCSFISCSHVVLFGRSGIGFL